MESNSENYAFAVTLDKVREAKAFLDMMADNESDAEVRRRLVRAGYHPDDAQGMIQAARKLLLIANNTSGGEPESSDVQSGEEGDADQYEKAEKMVGKEILYDSSENEGKVKGEVIDYTPVNLVEADTGEKVSGAVRFTLRLEDGSEVETTGMAPDGK